MLGDRKRGLEVYHSGSGGYAEVVLSGLVNCFRSFLFLFFSFGVRGRGLIVTLFESDIGGLL